MPSRTQALHLPCTAPRAGVQEGIRAARGRHDFINSAVAGGAAGRRGCWGVGVGEVSRASPLRRCHCCRSAAAVLPQDTQGARPTRLYANSNSIPPACNLGSPCILLAVPRAVPHLGPGACQMMHVSVVVSVVALWLRYATGSAYCTLSPDPLHPRDPAAGAVAGALVVGHYQGEREVPAGLCLLSSCSTSTTVRQTPHKGAYSSSCTAHSVQLGFTPCPPSSHASAG